MTAPAWMPFYVADYLADTGHLSAAEHGAYMLLIMHYWQHRGVPTDEGKLARISRMSPDEWAAARDTLADLFDEGWKHPRIEAELAQADDVISKRSAAGKAGASARYSKRTSKRMANAEQTHAPSPTPKEGSVAKATAEPRSAKSDTLDPKTILFRDGLTALAALTNRSPETLRPILGRWLKRTGDDCGAILAEIERCRGSPVADPVAWIEARLKPREPNGKPRRVSTAEQAATAMAGALERLGGQQQRERDADASRGDDGGPAAGGGNPASRALSANPHGYGTA